MASKHQSKKRVCDDDLDTDSGNEMLMKSETNWPRFLIVELASEDLPLQKLSPFAIQKGFQAIARTLKNIKRWLLLDRVWQKGPGPKPTLNKQIYWQTSQGFNSQDPELLSGSNQMSGPRWHVRGSDLGWTERSGCSWGEPSDTEEGVIPTNTLFLTFSSPELPKEITVGYLKVKVALFVPNPMRCFNCNKFGHTSQRCKVAVKCMGCGKDKHEG